jgi:hypothetical protein
MTQRMRLVLISTTPILALILSLGAPARAQQQQEPPPTPKPGDPQQPIPPISPNPGDNRTDTDQDSTNPSVVQTPLTGAAQASLTLPVNRSYILPAIAYYGQFDTNAHNVSNSNNYTTATLHSILGTVVLQRLSPHSQFDVGYLAGQSLSNQSGLTSTTQEFGISQSWTYAHWSALLADQFSYSSESSFFGATTPYGLAGIDQVIGQEGMGPILLNNTFVPNQSIFTVFGPRLSNAGIAEVDYRFTGRTSMTVVGNYNTLRFFNFDFVDGSAAGGQIGINHLLTRKDTIGVAYRYNDLWFSNFPDYIHDHLAEFLYERQLTRRLTGRIGAGPEYSEINSSAATSRTRTSWAAQASVRYVFERTRVGVSYDHHLTGGGGVFLGAVTDVASVGVDHVLSRLWSFSVSASYGRNTNLLPVQTALFFVPQGARFNSGYGGVQIHRRLGWQTEAFAGYTYRRQVSNFATCEVGVCGTNLTGHLVNFGILWRPERIAID